MRTIWHQHEMTWYHSYDVTTSEDGIDFLDKRLSVGTALKRMIIGPTLKSFPIILSSSFIPETYALEIFDRSRSEWDLNV